MSKLLDILRESADPNPSKIAKVLGISIEEVEAQLEGLRSEVLFLVGSLDSSFQTRK